MPDQNHFSDSVIISILRSKGFIVPQTEDDVDAFERAMQEHDIPALPSDVLDPDVIIKTPYARPGNFLAVHEENDQENLARAARDGKEISLSVLEKMRKDREDAEKDK